MIVPRAGTHSGGEAPYRSRQCDECLAPTSHLPLINWGCNSPLLYHIASYLLSARIAPWRPSIRSNLHPFDSEAVQILSQSICIVRDCLTASRNTEELAASIRERTRISTNLNNSGDLDPVKQINVFKSVFA